MPAKIEFGDKTVTITLVDGTVQVFTNAPVVSDTKVVVTHSDGTSEEFDRVESQ